MAALGPLGGVAGAAAFSLALHGLAWLGLGALPPLAVLLDAIREVQVELVAEPPPPPEPPEPVIEPPPELEPPPPEPEPEIRPREREPEPEVTPDPTPVEEVPPEEPPPLEERIEDFTGTTLTTDTAAEGPPIIGGNGAEITGPVGGATGTTTGRSRRGSGDGAPGGAGTDPEADGIPVVDAADLSRPTRPPEGFADLVSRHYPPTLRSRGLEGRAVVRFRVMPSGRLVRLRVDSETEPGFGQACLEALQESSGRWPAPIDRGGQEVAQNVRFTCTFSLRF